jgi:hypothetical protein
MDWLIHNAIADMYGPLFLLVYSAIALVIITVAYGIVRARRDRLARASTGPKHLQPV